MKTRISVFTDRSPKRNRPERICSVRAEWFGL